MFKFEVNEVSAIYIDHGDLINNSYNNQNISCDFLIKPELFVFNDRELGNNSRRKRKAEDISSNQCQEEISDLQRITTKGIAILKERKIFPQGLMGNNAFIKQFLEEDKMLPNMNGYNSKSTAHVTIIDNNKYLIPSHCKFFNCDVRNIDKYPKLHEKYDFIVMDPPWRNKYIRRVKKARKALGYDMLRKEALQEIPLQNCIKEKTLLVIWCTNSQSHQTAIMDELLPAWNMKFVAKWYWIKLNQNGSTVCIFNEPGKKQPFETIFIATHKANTDELLSELSKKNVIFSTPSVIHSHKPPLYEIFQKYLPENANCLELFARYLLPNFTSVGLEVLKLMDIRLYNSRTDN